MPFVEIRALNEPDALELAARLLKDEGVELKPSDSAPVQQRIVLLTDCVPFYIEQVCSRLSELDGPTTVDTVSATVLQQLTSDHDPWQMEHFRDRIGTYYAGTIKDTSGETVRDEEIARAVLDHLSLADQPQSIDEVWGVIKGQFKITDRNHVVEMLRSLSLDHYLISDTQKRYSFRFPLIQGWWKMAQGLEE